MSCNYSAAAGAEVSKSAKAQLRLNISSDKDRSLLHFLSTLPPNQATWDITTKYLGHSVASLTVYFLKPQEIQHTIQDGAKLQYTSQLLLFLSRLYFFLSGLLPTLDTDGCGSPAHSWALFTWFPRPEMSQDESKDAISASVISYVYLTCVNAA